MKMTKTDETARNYYAIEWSMGRAVCANTGDRYAVSYHSFPSHAARDLWCIEGGDFITSPRYREGVLSTDTELKRHIRNR